VVERDAGEEEGDERHALRALVEDVVADCAVRLVPSAPPPRCAACCDVVAAEGVGWPGLTPAPAPVATGEGVGGEGRASGTGPRYDLERDASLRVRVPAFNRHSH